MDLKVVGAGLGRTGTHSLKVALERLLGGRCHHMYEVFMDAERQLPLWQAAVDGAPFDTWAPQAMEGFVASVDWPSSRWYAELADANPGAKVLLSHRGDADTWWRSADRTIFVGMREGGDPDEFRRMARPLIVDHIGSYDDEAVAKAGYDRHNAEVRERIPADRLVEWMPSDGWGPLCAMLDVPEPDEPFPVTNTTAEFRARNGWD